MPNSIYLGIDFGTSHSSIAYVKSYGAADPRPQIDVSTVSIPVGDDGFATAERLPTVLASSMDGQRPGWIFGWEFFRQFWGRRQKTQLLRHGENFFHSVKSDLGTLRVYPHASSPDYRTPESVAAAIIKQLLEGAKKALPGHDVYKAKVVISVPASLSTLGREETLAAAKSAGLNLDNVDLVDEPVAALLDYLNSNKAAAVLMDGKLKNLLVFDYGGGTLDLSLVRASFDGANRSTGLRVLNLAISQYRRLGGDDIDKAIMETIVWPQIEKESGTVRSGLSSDVRAQVNDTLTPTVARQLKEEICRAIEQNADDDGEYSSHDLKVTKELHGDFDGIELPPRFEITAAEFEDIMRPFLADPLSDDNTASLSCSLLWPMLEVIDRGGLNPAQLDAVILHGGSCRNPLVRSLLSEHVGGTGHLFESATIEETPNLDTSVARGAALACYWKNERDVEIVAPIIAEGIGIMTLDDKPVTLVEANEDLPFPGEDETHTVGEDFYVPADNLERMLVPFFSGEETLRITNSILIDIPAGTKRGTKVAIKLRVERNKTLRWWCRIGKNKFFEAKPVNSPWASSLPSAEIKKLHDHRRAMRETLKTSGQVSSGMTLSEVSLLYNAGRSDDAELLVCDTIRRSGLTYSLANWLGLIAHQRGDKAGAVRWHGKAAEMAPSNAIIVGNYGCILQAAGRTQEAEAKMREALAKDPNLGYLYQWLGDMYRAQGNEERAQAEYGEALKIARKAVISAPDSADDWRRVANLSRRVGDYADATEADSRAARLAKSEKIGGDPRHVIAGPDSGVFSDEDAS
jgi:molecular chaperone DnaK